MHILILEELYTHLIIAIIIKLELGMIYLHLMQLCSNKILWIIKLFEYFVQNFNLKLVIKLK